MLMDDIKEMSKEEKAVQLLTIIAEEFKKDHEGNVYFDKEFILEVIDFLNYAKNEETFMKSLKNLDLSNY